MVPGKLPGTLIYLGRYLTIVTYCNMSTTYLTGISAVDCQVWGCTALYEATMMMEECNGTKTDMEEYGNRTLDDWIRISEEWTLAGTTEGIDNGTEPRRHNRGDY